VDDEEEQKEEEGEEVLSGPVATLHKYPTH